MGPGGSDPHARYGRGVTKNRLAGETSPYLRQHADNPVEWMPWGDEAFALARSRDVPVFLSVGYSSCHWCHVMAHESFENDVTAALMNARFVNVKVDREERPDVDAIYMQSVQALTGRGGWPMSVWCTPEGRPFYAGTYFPDSDRHGMPSFRRVCEAVSEAWRDRRDEVTAQSEQLTDALAEDVLRRDTERDNELDAGILDRAYAGIRSQFEPRYGGFGRAPKFPQAMTIDFLCRAYLRNGSDETRTMITTTLDAMAAGGIHDQLGGGFARYSTDDFWLVPHFEKMLYDNALLTRAYLHGYLVTGDALPARRRGHRRLRAARHARPAARLVLRGGRRLRRSRGEVLLLVDRGDPRGLRRRCRRGDRVLRRHRRRELRRSAHGVPGQHPARERPQR